MVKRQRRFITSLNKTISQAGFNLPKLYLWYILIDTRLKDVSVQTNKNPHGGSGGWSTCYSSSTVRGAHYNITCNINSVTPILRQFRITSNNTKALELREIEIYGYGK